LLQVEYRPLADLIPYARNSRTHSDEQVAQIAASIKEFGFTNPALVDDEGGIIAGHGRVKAAHLLGLETVPTIKLGHLSPTQRKAYVIADNRLALNAGWDTSMLSLELAELKSEDFSLDLLGFDDDELEKLLNPETVPGEGLTDPDAVPTDVETRCKPGDLWTLGGHRLLCGDSTNVQHVERLMGGEKADMVFTDPPYNHASDDKGVAASVSKAHADLMASDWDKNFSFLDVAGSIETALAKNATVYVCTSWHLAGQIWEWMSKRSSYSGYCVWHKPNPMPSLMKRHWTWASELVCYATFGKHTFNFPDEGHASNVWTIAKKSDGTHPTQKPIELVEHALSHSSKSGQSVLDLFLGSGSTLIACEKTGRRCFGMEIDPKYCDVVLTRWEQFTGKTATLSEPSPHVYADGSEAHLG
jgi:DNA modification methylase